MPGFYSLDLSDRLLPSPVVAVVATGVVGFVEELVGIAGFLAFFVGQAVDV